jgi:hypothetical protein
MKVERFSPSEDVKEYERQRYVGPAVLAKLAESGLVQLPPRQRRSGRQRLRVLSQPELFWVAKPERAADPKPTA